MPTNRELIQSIYDALGRGDAATVLQQFHPQIVWREAENFPYADRNPYVGPQQVADGVFGRLMSEWDGFAVIPERLLQDDDTVVTLGRYRGAFRATGRPLDAQFVHVWTVREGRVTGFQQYADTAQVARVTDTTTGPVAAPPTTPGASRPDAVAAATPAS